MGKLEWATAALRMSRLVLPVLACMGLVGACSGEKAPRRGQLVVAFQTDLSIPKDVQTLVVSIYSGGTKVYHQRFGLAPSGQFFLPGTLAIVEGDKKNQPITVRVAGLDAQDKPQVVRQAVSTVPTDRISLLHLPLQFLCIQPVTAGVDIDGTESYDDACTQKDQSCIAGGCVPDEIDERTLPTFAGSLVFGGADAPGLAGAKCLDVTPCFAAAQAVTPDPTDCSIPLPALGEVPEGPGGPAGGAGSPGPGSDTAAAGSARAESNFNIGLTLPPGSPGICDSARCVVAVDYDGLIGWREENGRAILPRAICDRLSNGQIDAVVTTESCVTKTTAVPTCGPWSNVTSGGQVGNDSGTSQETSFDDPCRGFEPGTYCEKDLVSDGAEAVIECGNEVAISKTPCNSGEFCNPSGPGGLPRCEPSGGGQEGGALVDTGGAGADTGNPAPPDGGP